MFRALRTSLPELIDPQQRRRWTLVVAIAVVASAVEALGAVMIYVLFTLVNDRESGLDVPLLGDLREHFPDASDATLIGSVAGVMALFFLGRAAILTLQAYLQNRTAQRAGALLSRRLLAGYLRMPYVFHLSRNSAESIRTAYQSVADIVSSVLVPVVMLISEALVVIAMLTVMVIVAPLATIATLVFLLPLAAGMLRFVQPRIAVAGEITQAAHEANLKSIQQSLTGVREIKVLGRERFFVDRFSEHRDALARAQAAQRVLTDIPRIGIETILMLLIVGFLGVTVVTDSSVDESLSILGLFGYAALRVMPALNRILAQLSSLRYGAAASENVLVDLRTIEDAPPVEEGVSPIPFERHLTLEDVTYRYPNAERDALMDVALAVACGESIGIVGPTGSGKSTLVDVMLGLFEPSAGIVACDGRDIRSNLPGWQRNLAVVPQVVFLLDDTLRRNIAMGVPDDEIDSAALAEAVRLAQLGDFVDALPRGLDSVVGEMGTRISGGQRQRVAIARALYGRPSVLFFDEGTSALDNATEAELIGALEGLRGEKTIFMVAHRLSTVRTCDRVLLVRDGRIVDSGPYDELAERNAEFQQTPR